MIINNINIKNIVLIIIERTDCGSLLLDNRLYYVGGYDKTGQLTSDFFYLDFTTSFNAKSPSFKDVAKTPFSHR